MRYHKAVALFVCPVLLGGCKEGILNPKGPIAFAELQILVNSLGIMLAIVIPTIFAIVAVAFWYRASNRKARYLPDFVYSGRLELLVWSIPAMTVMLVGSVAWVGAHDLDPRKPIPAVVEPVTVQVVSLDWKWLFIYPQLGIASVNHMVVPVGTPVNFELTSSGVMNSFFVPQLGSQIYTMSGMTTHLWLRADHAGRYPGFSANYSGEGFSGMRFTLDAVPADQFAKWLAMARGGGTVLDGAAYVNLAKPSSDVQPTTYRSVVPRLFENIVGSGMYSGFELSQSDSHFH